MKKSNISKRGAVVNPNIPSVFFSVPYWINESIYPPKIFIEDLSVLNTVNDVKMKTTQTLSSRNLLSEWERQNKIKYRV